MIVKNLETTRLNTTWNGLQITLVRNGNPDITGVDIRVDFRYGSKKGNIVKSCGIENGITILDAENGVHRIDAFRVDFGNAGTYWYDVSYKFGEVYKIYVGGSWEIEQNVTDHA